MAEETKAQDQEKPDQAGENPPQRKSLRARLARLLGRKSLISILLASVLIHGLGFWLYRTTRASVTPASLEVSVGEFHFDPTDSAATVISRADFKLHVSLLPEVQNTVRALLTTRKFKVQQDIEELMRQAHGGDFEEPTLSELKRQLREQINASLGMKAVDEVIITDLSVELPPVAVDSPVASSSDPAPEPAG